MRTITQLTEALFAKDGDAPVKVALPHTWNAQDGQDGEDDGSYWRGMGSYHLDLPAPIPGTRQYIEFQGANHVATVYCNGREIGTHRGGFSTFRYDLTEAMTEKENILTVEVTNAPSDVYPQMADFTFFGGLYRPVRLIQVPAAHFDLLKTGTTGLFITPHVAGLVRVDAFPVNAEGCTVRVDLCDASGAVVATGTAPAEAHTVLKLQVADPHLWNGRIDPYLYTAKATLLDGGDEMDEVTATFGFRSFHVDSNQGFFLNGKSYPLHGVARHQDRLDMGWAITPKEHAEDIALIQEVGANTIRLAHYQHDQVFYDLCDQTGMVVWAEIPFISRFNPSQAAHDNTISQMTELIAQNYNHPSICFWGISNEITIGGETEPLYQNLCELNALCKRLDPSRLTTMAELTMVPMDSEHVYITDVLSYNHYYGWYMGDVSENGPWLDEFHKKNPDRPVGISEYGAECILSWHSAKPENHDYTEEYQAYYHHEMLKTFAQRPYIWSTHVWNMFDFAADARDEGGCKGRNNKGLVTYDRKIKKDAFYVYKAYWTTEPMVHVSGRRFTDRAPGERTVTVYTNLPEVTLLLNGEVVGTQPAVDHAAVFAELPLQDGANTITARAGDVEDTITLNGVAESNPAYVLPKDDTKAGNWFVPEGEDAPGELEFIEGHFSINDKIGDILAHPVAGKILSEMFDRAGIGTGMMGMLSGFTLANMLKMAGKNMPASVPFTLNDKLNKIAK